VLVTGSCGLIGLEVSLFFAHLGYRVAGIDNNVRAVFLGPEFALFWRRSWGKSAHFRRESFSRCTSSGNGGTAVAVTEVKKEIPLQSECPRGRHGHAF
jgi:NAD(P)-dependent dehydrogenase (short-subunit alcohol dehydrogenase family)